MTSSLDLAYNTDLENLIIPEYGRNIHKMVEHAKKIEDREERWQKGWRPNLKEENE